MSLYLVPMISVPNISHAYFQSKGEESDSLRAGYKVTRKKNENTYALYDNSNPGEIDKNQILFPKSKFFISADLISITFPLPITFCTYTTTENALADLLYANLKLKKLIEEYENIQERSKKLIWDSQSLFQQRDNTGSVYQATRRLRESFIQTTEEIGVLVSNRVSSFRLSFDRNNRFRPDFRSTVNRPHANNTRVVRGHTSEEQDEGELEEEVMSSRKITSNPYRETSDPFVIKFFIKLANIIPYLIANKGEAVFYGIGLMLTFLFFSTILKK